MSMWIDFDLLFSFSVCMILTGVGSRLQTWGGLAAQWSDSTLRTYVANMAWTGWVGGFDRSGGFRLVGTSVLSCVRAHPSLLSLLPTQCA
jgi:hypothetical protein